MRMRKKPNLVPRMERCARFLIQAPEEQRGHWRELKPDAEQIWLELGAVKAASQRRPRRRIPMCSIWRWSGCRTP
jgi:hypothetical protein